MSGFRPIVQKDGFGCGVACTAYILGLNDEKTLHLFTKGQNKAKKIGFFCRDICKVLNKYSSKTHTFYCIKNRRKKNIYKDGTIVFIKRSKKYPSGHYLCRIGKYWMDPWINLQKGRGISYAKADFRKRLPGKPIYSISGNQHH